MTVVNLQQPVMEIITTWFVRMRIQNASGKFMIDAQTE
jgi:hypothetical protein